MSVSDRQSLAVQTILIGAMAVWGLNLTAVKVLTSWFEPTALAAVRNVDAGAIAAATAALNQGKAATQAIATAIAAARIEALKAASR